MAEGHAVHATIIELVLVLLKLLVPLNLVEVRGLEKSHYITSLLSLFPVSEDQLSIMS